MYTASDARRGNEDELDARIEAAVRNGSHGHAYLRIYVDDSFRHSIEIELTRRGFKNVQVPEMVLKGDVYFEWDT